MGDWNGSGTAKIGLNVNGFWVLDLNGNGSYDGIGVGQDRVTGFGGNRLHSALGYVPPAEFEAHLIKQQTEAAARQIS